MADLRAAGDFVVPLVRASGPDLNGAVRWDPTADALAPAAVSGFDSVIHLAGESLADGRWTAAKKQRIRDSRLRGTATLARALAAADRPPATFLCASGINYYGDHGDAVVDETTPRGTGFLADVCAAWEAAAEPLAAVSRVVHLRMGMVLAGDGGALAAMLPAFRWGLGGPVAGGGRYISWVTLDDVVRAFIHVLGSSLRGPANLVSPGPVTGKVFTAALAAALHRPAILPVPAWAVKLAFGQMADETVLASVRAVPRRLIEDGFPFHDPAIGPALRRVLGRADAA